MQIDQGSMTSVGDGRGKMTAGSGENREVSRVVLNCSLVPLTVKFSLNPVFRAKSLKNGRKSKRSKNTLHPAQNLEVGY